MNMPTYEYLCEKCGRFEEWQKMSEEPLKACPTCGGQVKRLISSNVSIFPKTSHFNSKDYSPSKIIEKAKKYQESTGKKLKGYGDIIESHGKK